MSFLKLVFLLAGLSSGLVLLVVFLFMRTEDQGVLTGKVGNGFAPGSFDAARNKVMAVLVTVFAVSLLVVSAIEYRSKKLDLSEVSKERSAGGSGGTNGDDGASGQERDYEEYGD